MITIILVTISQRPEPLPTASGSVRTNSQLTRRQPEAARRRDSI